jgi:hypothetical protein
MLTDLLAYQSNSEEGLAICFVFDCLDSQFLSTWVDHPAAIL